MKKNKLSSEKENEINIKINEAIHKKLLEKASSLKNEYKKQVSTALMTAFGLVIALVWKDVVTALIPSITTPGFLEDYPLLGSFYTASIVTIIAVFGILLIANWSKSSESK